MTTEVAKEMIQRSIRVVDSIEPGKPDDLFLCCSSFEERSVNAAALLSRDLEIENAFIIRFEGGASHKSREKCQTALRLKLESHLMRPDNLQVLHCDKYDPLHGLTKVEGALDEIKRIPERITIDITTFTKQYLLVILRTLDRRFPKAKIRTLYTSGKYDPQIKHPLTWGIKKVTTIPFFNRAASPEKRNLLILFLGYEGERAYAIWKAIEPDRTIAVIGRPAAYPGADIPSEKLNKPILERINLDVTRLECPALDVGKTKELLEQFYKDEEYRNFNIFVAPLGTKMQALGIYLFFRANPNSGVHVIYAIPLWYDDKYYTRGYMPEVIEYYLPYAESGRPKNKAR